MHCTNAHAFALCHTLRCISPTVAQVQTPTIVIYIQVARREVEGMGEMLLEIGGGENAFGPEFPLDKDQLNHILARINEASASWDVTATVLHQYTDYDDKPARNRADVLLRKVPGSRQPLEVIMLHELFHTPVHVMISISLAYMPRRRHLLKQN